MSMSEPLSEEAKEKIKALVEVVKNLTDQEYYWFRDWIADLPEIQMCCLRRDSDYNCGCNEYNTPLDDGE